MIRVAICDDNQRCIGETHTFLQRMQEKENHGYGLSVMEELLEQHNGNMKLVWSDRQFQVQILFYHAV